MQSRIKVLPFIITICNAIAFPISAYSSEQDFEGFGLEEVVVTAQKREQSLQNTPIAISVLTEKQLLQRGVTSLNDLLNNSITSLNINPYAEATSTLILSIRGNGLVILLFPPEIKAWLFTSMRFISDALKGWILN